MTTESIDRIEIDDMRIDHGTRGTVWQSHGIDIENPETHRPEGSEETALMIVLDVDGMFDILYADLRGSWDVHNARSGN